MKNSELFLLIICSCICFKNDKPEKIKLIAFQNVLHFCDKYFVVTYDNLVNS